MAEGFTKYNDYPIETRRDLLRKDLKQKPNQLIVEFLKRWLYYTARGCNRIGRTEAEMAQLYINYVKDALSSITLKDLLHEGLRLSTSSIAGADKRLNFILDKRFDVKVLTLYSSGRYNRGMLRIHKCLRCGHEWPSRLERLPKVCPKCNSPYWNKPKWKGVK